MKILLTSDWHASPQNLDLCHLVVENVISVLQNDRDIGMVIHLGDIKQPWNPVDQRITNFLVESVKAIVRKVPFVLLLGNHDRMGVDDDLPSCQPVVEATGALVVSEPVTLTTENGALLAMVPFLRDQSNLERAVRKAKGDYLFFHFEVRGAHYNVYSESHEGLPKAVLRPTRFRKCFGGHIHQPQFIAPNIQYVGSPFAIDWGEVNQTKRFLILDLDQDTVTEQQLHIRNYVDPTAPGYVKRKLSAQDVVRIKVPYTQHKDLLRRAETVRKKVSKEYAPAQVHLVFERPGEQIHVPLRGSPESDRDLITEYVAHQQFFSKQPKQRNALIDYLTELLDQQPIRALKPISFEFVKATNVLSYEKVEFTYKPGLTLITGRSLDWKNRSNGSGKTNLLSLPALALFGANSKGQSHDEWRRNGARGASTISLQIKVDDKPIEVIRSRKPVGLRAIVDGKNVLPGNARSAQEALAQLTGLSLDALLNSLYIDQREVNTLLSGTEKQRKDLLSQFLGLHRFEEAVVEARARLTDTQKQLDAIEHSLAESNKLLKTHKESLRQLPQRNKQLVRAERSYQRQIGNLLAQYYTLRYFSDHVELEALHGVFTSLHTRLQAELSNIEQRLYALRRDLRQLEGLKDRCPTCHQPVDKTFVQTCKQKLINDIDRLEQRRKYLAAQVEHLDLRAIKLADVLQEKAEQRKQASQSLERLLSELGRTVDEIEMYESIVRVRQSHEKALEDVRREQKRLKEERRKLEMQLEVQKLAVKVLARTGIPAFLMTNTCPKLNAAAAFYSSMFTEGEIQVDFAITEDGQLDVEVHNAHGAASLKGQSEGELRMASLITGFAVRDVLTRFNLLILDEPGDGLDSVNAQLFAAALPQVVKRFDRVVVTTHNPYIATGLEPDRCYEVVKHNGVSTLREV